MSIRNNYSYSGSSIPGGIVDMSPRKVNSRTAEEKIGFGLGVVVGETAGTSVKLPVANSTAAQFEGVALNGGTNEFDLEGKVVVNKGGAMSVMRFGNVYVRVAADAEPAYGDDAYLIVDGDEAGYFTNEAPASIAVHEDDGKDDTETTTPATPTVIAIKGKFLSGVSNGIAALELFNQSQD